MYFSLVVIRSRKTDRVREMKKIIRYSYIDCSGRRCQHIIMYILHENNVQEVCRGKTIREKERVGIRVSAASVRLMILDRRGYYVSFQYLQRMKAKSIANVKYF